MRTTNLALVACVVALAVSQPAQAIVLFSSLHNFGVFTNGEDPSGLVQGNDGSFYGTTGGGGTNGGYGAVFKITAEGVVSSVYSFSNAADGAGPGGLVQGADGNFYGTAGGGGATGHGTVFRISTDGMLTTLYSFTNGADGEYPGGGLIRGSDGNFYGTMPGDNNFTDNRDYGRVFKITPDGSFTVVHAFTNGFDGAKPSVVVQGNDGNLYGMTLQGGTNGLGAIFRISTSPGGKLVVLHSFGNVNGGPNAILPQSLIQGSDGNFYGTTSEGGTNGGFGTIFQMSPEGAVTVLHSFTGGEDGGFLSGALVQGSDGNLYGTTEGATNSSGSVFKISLDGKLTTLYFFANGLGGGYPAGLIQGADGNFYGTIVGFINHGDVGAAAGAVFKITPTGAFSSLYVFGYDNGGGDPQASLVQGKDGSFYGTTMEGGTGDAGTVFKIDSSGAFANLYSFTNGDDGANPEGSLVQGGDGNFYGTAYNGGTNGFGTVFKISATGLFTSLYSFTNGATTVTDGANPQTGLVQDGSYFYGTTDDGGYYFNGNVFVVSTLGKLFSLYSFFGLDDGANPEGPLALGRDGYFYGTAFGGGSDNYGTVFKVSSKGGFLSLYSFTNGIDGAGPEAGLVQGSDGNFYGTTSVGTVFKISSRGAFTSLYDFGNGADGGQPQAGLIEGKDGNFYGTTYSGGINGFGSAFEISPSGVMTVLYSFTNGLDGAFPQAGLVQGSDGNFYGTTTAAGVGGNGGVFRISTATGSLQVTLAPGTVAASGAMWELDSDATLEPSGAIVSNLPVGSHTVTFTAAPNWNPPANQIITIASNHLTSVTGTYTLPPGALQVSLTPSAAVAAGAEWRVDGGAYHTNGVVVTNLSVSTNHLVSFKTVAGFSTPSNQWVTIVKNQITLVLGAYAETTKPSVTITNPASGVRSADVTMAGTAADHAQVAEVNYWITNLNGSPLLSGQAALSAGKTSSNWIVQATPHAGSNVLAVQAVNYSGLDSPTASVSFFYRSTAVLSLAASPAGLGIVTGTASIKADPAPSNGANLYIGEGYSVTAKELPAGWFTNWTANGVIATTNATLSFIMDPGLMLQANFNSNRFIPLAGRYDGLFTVSNGAGLVVSNSGVIGNLQLGTNGSYSGTLYLGGASYPIKGAAFSRSGQAVETVGNMVLKLNLPPDDVSPRILTGSLQGTHWLATNLMLYAAQTNTQNVRYVMLFGSNGISPEWPPGCGYVLITNINGTLTLAGGLPDGSTFSESTALGEDDEFPLYANLYKSSGGILLARLSPSGATFGAGNTVDWVKPTAKTGSYAKGFVLEPGVQDSIWTNEPGLLTNLFGAEAQLTLAGPGLSNALALTVDVTASNTLMPVSGQPNLAGVTLNRTNGLLTVVFTNNAKQKITAYGTVLANFPLGGGYYLGTTNAGLMTLGPAP